MNPLDFALQMELDGQEYYSRLAEDTNNSQMKQAFLAFAADEQKHYQAILALKDSSKCNYVGSNTLTQIKGIFSDGIRKGTESVDQNLLDAYKLALDMELKSIKLYKDLGKQAENEQDEELFGKLVKEEEMHHSILWKLTELMQRPEEWYPYLEL